MIRRQRCRDTRPARRVRPRWQRPGRPRCRRRCRGRHRRRLARSPTAHIRDRPGTAAIRRHLCGSTAPRCRCARCSAAPHPGHLALVGDGERCQGKQRYPRRRRGVAVAQHRFQRFAGQLKEHHPPRCGRQAAAQRVRQVEQLPGDEPDDLLGRGAPPHSSCCTHRLRTSAAAAQALLPSAIRCRARSTAGSGTGSGIGGAARQPSALPDPGVAADSPWSSAAASAPGVRGVGGAQRETWPWAAGSVQ